MPEKIIIKISPTPSLQVQAPDAMPDLLSKGEPVVVLGNDRTPDIIAPPVAPSPHTLFGPRGACLISKSGPLWISDTGHHRILGWKECPTSDMANSDWVIGQNTAYDEGRNGKTEVDANTLNVPTGICAAAAGLAVADAWNNRVLLWKTLPTSDNTPADVVLGQDTFRDAEQNRGNAHPTASTMHWPYGVAFHNGRLFVADSGNRRILIWNELPSKNGQPADLVLGQNEFDVRDENASADPSAMSMRWPHGIAFWNEKLCVSDAGNNRIMIWNSMPTKSGADADIVLGQESNQKVEHNQTLYWPRAHTLNMPYGLAAIGPWLIAADTANSRVVAWHEQDRRTGGSASRLLGQRTFNDKGDNRWQPTCADSVCWPYGLCAVDGLLVVADSGNNRISIWKLEE